MMKTMAEKGREASSGQGLLTWGPPAVEDMDVHEVFQILLQGLPVQPCQPVSALYTLGLPVRPIDALSIEGQPKWVGELASNQHLPGTQHLCHHPPRSGTQQWSRAWAKSQNAAWPLLPPAYDLEQELVIKSL